MAESGAQVTETVARVGFTGGELSRPRWRIKISICLCKRPHMVDGCECTSRVKVGVKNIRLESYGVVFN